MSKTTRKTTGYIAPKRKVIDRKNPGYREQYGVIVICKDEAHQRATFERLQAEGLNLRVVTT